MSISDPAVGVPESVGRGEIVRLKEENLTLREQLVELRQRVLQFESVEQDKSKISYEARRNVYVKSGTQEVFCARCLDFDNALVHVRHADLTHPQCPECAIRAKHG